MVGSSGPGKGRKSLTGLRRRTHRCLPGPRLTAAHVPDSVREPGLPSTEQPNSLISMLEAPTGSAVPDLVLTHLRLAGAQLLCNIHIHGGLVVRITPPAKSAGVPAGVPVLDLDGRFVIPGLWDEHVHLTQWALAAHRIDLSGAASARAAADVVRSFLQEHADDGVPVVGVGFRDALWHDAPTRELLDGATRGLPTALLSHDLHCVWLNSAASARYGVPVDASGLLREQPAFELTRILGQLPDAVVDRWVRDAGQAAAARGIVGIVDFEMAWNRDAWLRRIAGGFDSVRVDAGVYPQDLDRAVAEGMRTGQLVAGGAGLLRVGPLEGADRRLAEHPHGVLRRPVPARRPRAAHRGRGGVARICWCAPARPGFVPAVHAIGDAANQVALDAFESGRDQRPD